MRIWPFPTSLTLCTTVIPSVLRPKHCPGSLRMGRYSKRAAHYWALRRNVRDLPTVEDVHFAFIDIMRSSVHQPIDAAEKL